MGDLYPYWDGRLPILGVDAGFAGDRWDMVVKRLLRSDFGKLSWTVPGSYLLLEGVHLEPD
jgi:hypothetical protein